MQHGITWLVPIEGLRNDGVIEVRPWSEWENAIVAKDSVSPCIDDQSKIIFQKDSLKKGKKCGGLGERRNEDRQVLWQVSQRP